MPACRLGTQAEQAGITVITVRCSEPDVFEAPSGGGAGSAVVAVSCRDLLQPVTSIFSPVDNSNHSEKQFASWLLHTVCLCSIMISSSFIESPSRYMLAKNTPDAFNVCLDRPNVIIQLRPNAPAPQPHFQASVRPDQESTSLLVQEPLLVLPYYDCRLG
jgi:hypothetical protein